MTSSHAVWLGTPYPLGANWDGQGTNFSLYSQSASMVELCLFDDGGRETRIELPDSHAHVHHGYLPGIGPGQRYGYRVHGPWDPAAGLLANPAMLLLDPYARAIEGEVQWGPAVLGHSTLDPDERQTIDSAPFVPRSIVVDDHFDWGDDRPPRIPWHETCIYETHVRGLTMRHPDVPPELRGTYAGMATPAVIEHLVSLGVTAVELMPVHHFTPEGFLLERGLTNYWGYSTAGFFAPHGPYSASGQRGQQVVEFKSLVKALHDAGLEVLLDVVYNHTAEGSAEGPTLCWRGIDNATYYRLRDDDRRQPVDFTGTGNSLNVRHPTSLQLVMDSLRYWVQEMHVDGFRFDLASTLAREFYEVDRLSSFFDLIQQDPVVNRTKLIAEPWDVGPGGYQVGNFPPLWSEWNARYRDGVRDFWRGRPASLGDFAYRFTGSSDLYDEGGRRPSASINFVTAHDGFTLADLVGYERKHNLANGEHGHDGHDDNRSWNGGVEGLTSDPSIRENRRRRMRAMLATLMLSQGVPMLSGGDEIGRTQRGNNNAYCHDSELTWYDWARADGELVDFVRALGRLRAAHPVFRRRRFFRGRPAVGADLHDIVWMRPDGQEMRDEDWHAADLRAIAVFLNGAALGPQGPTAEPATDSSFLVLANGGPSPVSFTLQPALGAQWRLVVDTSDPRRVPHALTGDAETKVEAWTLVLLEAITAGER